MDTPILKTELDVLKFWEAIKAFETSIKNNEGCPEFIFYDGPPFATGLPHYGHIVTSTLKDIFPRYKTQMGYKVERRFGFDTHGLPIEYEIEKKLGIKTKQEVEAFGIGNYNEECRKIVLMYSKEWRTTITRLGRWVDFDNDYKTMDPSYMESVWWVFGQLWKKGMIYQGSKVMPYSTGCHTPLSNFEAKSNYKEVQDPSVVVKMRVKNAFFPESSNVPTYLLVWTTTPWTLLSNQAVCASPNMIYVCIKTETPEQAYYILSKSSLNTYFKKQKYIIVSSFTGNILTKYHYEPLYEFFTIVSKKQLDSDESKCFTVLNDTYVKDEDITATSSDASSKEDDDCGTETGTGTGTGLVHLAPAFGDDDYRVCCDNNIVNRYRIPPCPIDDNGMFTSEVGRFAGLYFKDADSLIIKDLKERGLLFSHKQEKHKYPYCWRSDTPLIYKNVTCWFIDVKSIAQKLLDHNEKVNWVPEYVGKSKFRNWLENSQDWCVSRDRYWGTPIPIWVSDDNLEQICISSVGELEELAGLPSGSVTDLHSHFIDHITIPSKMGKGKLRRIPQTADCWFDSSSMPYAQCHYPFENKERFDANFPCDFIAEGSDQTRGWFYTLLVISTALFDKPAYKNVLVNGMVLAEDGEKMSKRKQNYPAPDLIMDKYGADALRLYLIDSKVVRGDSLRFQEEGLKNIVKDVHIMIDNMVQYRSEAIAYYNSVSNVAWSPVKVLSVDGGAAETVTKLENSIDSWIFHCLEEFLHELHKSMNKYDLSHILSRMKTFIDRLSRWYIKLNKTRFRVLATDTDLQDVRVGLSVLEHCLHYFSIAIAPFAPFLAEIVYQKTLPNMRHLLTGLVPEHRLQSVHYNAIPGSACAGVVKGNEIPGSACAGIAKGNEIPGSACAGIAKGKEIPQVLAFTRNEKMIVSMEYLIKAVNMIRCQRTQRVDTSNPSVSLTSIKLPYKKAILIHSDPKVLAALKQVEDILTTESNILECEYESGPEQFLNYKLLPNFRLLGKKLGRDIVEFKVFLESLTENQIEKIIFKNKVIVKDTDTKEWVLIAANEANEFQSGNLIDISQLTIETQLKEESQSWQISYDGDFIVLLDPTVTSELEEVYYMKYFSRKVQEFRRSIGLQLSDNIRIVYRCKAGNKAYNPEFFARHKDVLSSLIGELEHELNSLNELDLNRGAILGKHTFPFDDEEVYLVLYK